MLSAPPARTAVPLAEAARFWAGLGLVSFGGPAGQISLLHRELVERRRWLSDHRFLHALQYCMLLPGPEATQLATYLGWLLHGVPGGLIAGGLFLLPSVVVITLLATVYALWGTVPLLASVFWALKPTVLAIVLVAAWRMGRRTLGTPGRIGIALAAFAGLTLAKLPYPALIALAALWGWICGRWRPAWVEPPSSTHAAAAASGASIGAPEPGPAPLHGDDTPPPAHAHFSSRGTAAGLLLWGVAQLLPLALLSAALGWDSILPTLARFFTQVALLSFGGAYAVLPYVAQGAVEQHGWLTAGQMVDGLALGESTPGPLIMVVAFVGFMGGWNHGVAGPPESWPGALAATLVTVWFTFLPSFGFILIGAPLVEASRRHLALGAPLGAITAAVSGVIGSLAVFFAGPVLWPGGQFDPGAGLLLALALLALLQLRWGILPVLGAAALIGGVLH